MRGAFAMSAAAAGMTMLALAGCATTGSAGSASGSGRSANTSSSATATGGPSNSGAAQDLSTAGSSLGRIVVDGKGMSVYFFDKDTAGSGASACTGACLVYWHPVTTSDVAPHASGVSGTVATIKDPDGRLQITVDGRPLYTFAGDTARGDVKGEGVQNAWWAVSPSGQEVKPAGSTSGY